MDESTHGLPLLGRLSFPIQGWRGHGPGRLGFVALLYAILLAGTASSSGALVPDHDERGNTVFTLNTLRTFPVIHSKEQWQERAGEIRTQILVSAGLWPMPDRTPLQPQSYDRSEHDGFTVEKVRLQTHPGFFLTGNLYRPRDRGAGPFPAVLNPHGHWKQGRCEDGTNASVVARCITQARLGLIAFSYDMVGYHETQFADTQKESGSKAHRLFGTQPADLLWNINLMGLQTWNSLRALDFLCSLPEVDTRRLGCTGASGGGTQTFTAGALDDRLTVLAPTVMVSHVMQGGCLCENMPGLRLEYSNMEIAAVPAPKPQIMMAATGDWTKTTMTVEGPAVASIYKLFTPQPRLKFAALPYNHNYNRDTREHVYAFLARHLLNPKQPPTDTLPEPPYPEAAKLNLTGLPAGETGTNGVTMAQLAAYLRQQAAAKFKALLPKNKDELSTFRAQFEPVWRHTLQVRIPADDLRLAVLEKTETREYATTRLVTGRDGCGDRLPLTLYTPTRAARERHRVAAVLAHPKGRAALLNAKGEPDGILRQLVSQGVTVVVPELFQTGAAWDEAKATSRTNQINLFYATYNRTDAQERVQDLLTACAFARMQQDGTGGRVVLCGLERAGAWTLLAAPAADGVVADAGGLDPDEDTPWLNPDWFVPGVRRLAGWQGALILAAPNAVGLYNLPKNSEPALVRKVFGDLDEHRQVRTSNRPIHVNEIANWVYNMGK